VSKAKESNCGCGIPASSRARPECKGRLFIYSGDAADALARLLLCGYTEPLNIGTGIGTSIKELAEIVARLTGFNGEIVWDTSKADGVMRKVLDISRMESILGWKPTTSLEASLSKTIRWYLANKADVDERAWRVSHLSARSFLGQRTSLRRTFTADTLCYHDSFAQRRGTVH
jgi:hypothetical protein